MTTKVRVGSSTVAGFIAVLFERAGDTVNGNEVCSLDTIKYLVGSNSDSSSGDCGYVTESARFN